MKLKKLIAVLLSAATLAASPSLPILQDALKGTEVIAEAADTIIAQFQKDNLSYQAFKTSSGTTYAAVTNSASNLTSVAIPATVTNEGKTYPVTRIKPFAFWYKNIQAVSFNSTNLTIESNSFSYTSKLSLMAAQSSVQNLTIEQNAFTQSGIQTFNCYAKTCTINSNAFENSNLYLIQFGTQVQTINLNSYALANTKKLTKVIFNNYNVWLNLGNRAFQYSSVRDISIPSSVTTIPERCFEYCSNLRYLSLPDSITTIKSYAFSNAVLPAAMYITYNMTDISTNAFYFAKNVSAYYVDSRNTKFKAVNGVLYNKNGDTLCAYPENKKDSSFRFTGKTIWSGAFSNNSYLNTLDLPNFSSDYGPKSEIGYLANLENLQVKSSESDKTPQDIISHYSVLFTNTKLHKFNGIECVKIEDGKEPTFDEKFDSYIRSEFETKRFTNNSILKYYIDKMAEYVVNKVTTSSMTQLQKAVRLHQWICERVVYDPDVKKYDRMKEEGLTPSETLNSDKNHVDASVFLHQKSDGKYYSVCDGYARAYKILMDKAHIPTDYVSGKNRFNSNLSSHVWNLVKLDGKWYHVDVTWDDQDYIVNEEYDDGMVPDSNLRAYKNTRWRYNFFLMSDEQFRNDGHNKYAWASREHPELNWQTTVATDSTLSMRGDLDMNGSYDSADVTRMKQLNGQQANTDEKKRADIDRSGYVNSTDLSLLNEHISNWWMFDTLAGRMYSKQEY